MLCELSRSLKRSCCQAPSYRKKKFFFVMIIFRHSFQLLLSTWFSFDFHLILLIHPLCSPNLQSSDYFFVFKFLLLNLENGSVIRYLHRILELPSGKWLIQVQKYIRTNSWEKPTLCTYHIKNSISKSYF